jgi:conjugal transfer/type IV secretion protein DotA/TraY
MVPMLFYITWMFAIVNCIAFAAEFVLAAPLAAFQHMRIFGQQAINQEQRQFYLISFLNGILRPSFLLFGLAISTYVLSAISEVLDKTFNLAVASSLGGAVVGPIGIIVFVLMLGYLQYQLMIRSVHLITRAPDAVADLVGGAIARMGGSAEEGLGVGQSVYGQSRVVSSGIMKVASVSPAKAVTSGGGVSGSGAGF